MNPTEDDGTGIPLLFSDPSQLQRVPGEVGKLDHIIPLIMMAHDDQITAQSLLRLLDALTQLSMGQVPISVRQCRMGQGETFRVHMDSSLCWMSRLISKASTEWVSQPREIPLTPVSATCRAVSGVMPPDASVQILPSIHAT